jgi:hypothetical protein
MVSGAPVLTRLQAMRMDEREFFTRHLDADPDRVWAALRRTLATWDLRDADDVTKTARFDAGMSWTSWGSHLLATVTPDAGGARITVRGRPKSSLLTTKLGEDVAVREIEKTLMRGLERHLAGAG